MRFKVGIKYKALDKTVELLGLDLNGKHHIVIYDIAGHYVFKHLDDLELAALQQQYPWREV